MTRVPLGSTGLQVFPLALGTNVFGWTASEPECFALLDAYVEAGGNLIDTADFYTWFAPGLSGGESETIIGRWLRSRTVPDDLVIMTKVGKLPGTKGLAPETIRRGLEASLGRLGVERVDVYYAHEDDPSTPLEESLATFDALVREGKVAHLAASNYTPDRLREALDVSEREGFAAYALLEAEYSLVAREEFEGGLQTVGVPTLPFWGLARGFLTGKYRRGEAPPDTPRAEEAGAFLEGRGERVLEALDAIAADRGVPHAAIALAWLRTRETVVAPVASARNPAQLADLVRIVELTPDEADALSRASA